jgi:DnaJ-class molecular chaperone
MNPFRILGIEPTDNKILIRRAYVEQTKKHHPDHGGDPLFFYQIKQAYEELIAGSYQPKTIETTVELELKEFLTGCVATAILYVKSKATLIEFDVPALTYPGSTLKFFDHEHTDSDIAVTLNAAKSDYMLLKEHILIQRELNINEARAGTTLSIVNFDNHSHFIKIPEGTTANKLIYEIEHHGFFDKATKKRGDLKVLVNINKKVN